MKPVKKITAAVTAMAMAVGMMSIGASANPPVSTYKYYNLYMVTGLPGNMSNVTSLNLGGNGSDYPQYYSTEIVNNLEVIDRRTSISSDYITITGRVWKNNSWHDVITFNHYSSEAIEKPSGNQNVPNTPVGTLEQIHLVLHINQMNVSASGQAIAK